MHWLNHFLVPFTILFILFEDTTSLATLAVFTLIFGILPDSDVIIRRYLFKSRRTHLRTFLQEPFGGIVIGVPSAVVCAMLWGYPYFFLPLIPYASHILLDYITLHSAFPYAPFRKKRVSTGFITPVIGGNPESHRQGLFSENYVMYVTTAVFLVTVALV